MTHEEFFHVMTPWIWTLDIVFVLVWIFAILGIVLDVYNAKSITSRSIRLAVFVILSPLAMVYLNHLYGFI